MIKRFRQIAPDLFRGSAPSVSDVQKLKKQFNINRIVSLDQTASDKIDKICKLLKIEHITIPLDGSKKSLIKLLRYNLKDLLLGNPPTFIHCMEGKDRTGLLSALFKCKYLGVSPEKALKEAKSLGFGIGVDPKIISLYEKIIKNCKPEKGSYTNDIVSNEREYISDTRTSPLDESQRISFAPYLSYTKEHPYDSVYNSINDQSPTRENYKQDISINQHKSDVPLVGLYNNDAGIHGVGPVENMTGFFYD